MTIGKRLGELATPTKYPRVASDKYTKKLESKIIKKLEEERDVYKAVAHLSAAREDRISKTIPSTPKQVMDLLEAIEAMLKMEKGK